MVTSQYGLDLIVQESTDKVFLRAMHRQIEMAWQDARDEMRTSGYAPEIIYYMFAQSLRAKTDHRLTELGKAYPDYPVEMKPTRQMGSYYAHVTMGRTLLTISAVRHRNEVPRDARYRNDNARLQTAFDINSTGQEFEILSVELGNDSGTIYGIVLHGPRVGRRYELGFVDIAFLDRDGVYLPERLDIARIALDNSEQEEEVVEISNQIEVGLRNRQDLDNLRGGNDLER